MKRTMLIAMVLVGCGGSEPAPRIQLAPVQPAMPECLPNVQLAELKAVDRELPARVSPEGALLAVQKVLFANGTDLASINAAALTMTSQPMTGQTIQLSCRPYNRYVTYVVRASSYAGLLHISLDCFESIGSEVPFERNAPRPCPLPAMVGQGDTTMAGNIADAAIAIADTEALQHMTR